MPPCLDIYVLTNLRDAATLKRFVDRYVDRASGFRDDLSLLPIGADWRAGGWDFEWESTPSLNDALERALRYPRRAFALYLPSRDARLYRVILGFTTDDRTVLGASIDYEPDGDEADGDELVDQARSVLHEFADRFDGDAGFVAVEEVPPLDGNVDVGKPLYSWKR